VIGLSKFEFEPSKWMDMFQYAIRDLEANKIEAERRKAGKKVLNLNIGDLQAKFQKTDGSEETYVKKPQWVIEKLNEAASETHYGNSQGEVLLREALARDAKRSFNFDAKIEKIYIYDGSSGGINDLFHIWLSENVGVITFVPHYPLYGLVVTYRGKIVKVDCREEEGWLPNVDDVKKEIKAAKAAGIDVRFMLMNPQNNPTGAIYPEKLLKELADVAYENEIVVVSDEPYIKNIFSGEKAVSMLKILENSEQPHIVFNSASKQLGLPGWRIGWAIIPGDDSFSVKHRERATKLSCSRLSPPVPNQIAVAKGLDDSKKHEEWLKEVNKNYEERSRFAFKRLNEIEEVRCVKSPKSTFYIFPQVAKNMYVRIVTAPPIDDVLGPALDDLEKFIKEGGAKKYKRSEQFARELLREKGVRTVQGSGFGVGN
jgi:aspartate/methionine/tyrosine aminotransferase